MYFCDIASYICVAASRAPFLRCLVYEVPYRRARRSRRRRGYCMSNYMERAARRGLLRQSVNLSRGAGDCRIRQRTRGGNLGCSW